MITIIILYELILELLDFDAAAGLPEMPISNIEPTVVVLCYIDCSYSCTLGLQCSRVAMHVALHNYF